VTSERDQNFLIVVGGRPRAVLKVASARRIGAASKRSTRRWRISQNGVDDAARAHRDERGRNTVEVRGDDGRSHPRLGREPSTCGRWRKRAIGRLGYSRRSAAAGRDRGGGTRPPAIATLLGYRQRARNCVERPTADVIDAERAAIDTLVDRFDRHTARFSICSCAPSSTVTRTTTTF
jgi:hypothetical protein